MDSLLLTLVILSTNVMIMPYARSWQCSSCILFLKHQNDQSASEPSINVTGCAEGNGYDCDRSSSLLLLHSVLLNKMPPRGSLICCAGYGSVEWDQVLSAKGSVEADTEWSSQSALHVPCGLSLIDSISSCGHAQSEKNSTVSTRSSD